MHLTEGVPKREVARRLGVDVKTVRRHVNGGDTYPARRTPKRGRALDGHRAKVEKLLQDDAKLSAKRVGRLLETDHGVKVSARTVRRYVNEIRGAVQKPEAFVHRTHPPGETMEIDFGESWALIAGQRTKVFFFVATLPASNVYFAKAYRLQRIESLLDGITSAIEWFGGLPTRVVFDNASLAVKKIGLGSKREETDMFLAYRTEWPLRADFCAPASGWEKGSAEKGVHYVRGLTLLPMPVVSTLDELNEMILRELELDMDRRELADGRPVREAFTEEQAHLRPLPGHRPETCRVLSSSANKFAHVHVDRSSYSVPTDLARKTLTVKRFHDRVEVIHGADVVAVHQRSAVRGAYVLELEHTLDLLLKKPRAAQEATVIRQIGLPPCFDELREALRDEKRHSVREWVKVIGLLVDHSLDALTAAVKEALQSGAPGVGSIKQILRRKAEPRWLIEPIDVEEEQLAQYQVPQPDLSDWDVLVTGVRA